MYVLEYKCQSRQERITTWTDSDFAGCIKSRISTSGGLVVHGGHLMKSWSTNQIAIALSSLEAEYYSPVMGRSLVVGFKATCLDLGVECKKSIEIESDAGAAIGIVKRIGLGRVRHIQVSQLWSQEKVSKGEILGTKVKIEENLADALTKPASKDLIGMHITGAGGGPRQP